MAAASASQDGSKIGIVTNLSRGTYSGSGANSSYTADTVTILATDGRTYSYQWTTDYFKLGNLVQVVISSEDGSVSLKRLSETGKLSGKVSSDASKLGSYPFADGVEILDTYEGTGVRIYPERLAGLNVTTDMVRYYTLNGAGEITKLILKDATGDMHSYGIMTDVVDSSPEGGVSVIVSYTMDLAGEIVSLPGMSVKYGVKKGPVVVMGNVQAPDKIRQLTEVEAARVSGNTVTAGNRTYLMSDNVLVYEYRGGDYYLSSLDRVKDGGYELSAWYDRSEKDGGPRRGQGGKKENSAPEHKRGSGVTKGDQPAGGLPEPARWPACRSCARWRATQGTVRRPPGEWPPGDAPGCRRGSISPPGAKWQLVSPPRPPKYGSGRRR